MPENTIVLNEFQRDILNEIGSITSGNATTALSKLVHRGIMLTMPECKVISANKLIARYSVQEMKVLTTYIETTTNIKGHALLLLPEENAAKLVELAFSDFSMYGSENISQTFMEQAILEIGNIFTGSYIGALANLLEMQIETNMPLVVTDKVDTIIKYVAQLSVNESNQKNENLMYFETKIEVQNIGLVGVFVFILPYDSLIAMIKRVEMLSSKTV